MIPAIASWLGRPSQAPIRSYPLDAVEVERRRRALREGVLGFGSAIASAGARADLDRLGYGLRVSDLDATGNTEAAPVNTWALYPGARREVWLAYADTDDPWYAHAHAFATRDGATYLALRLTPTQIADPARALSLHARFDVVVHEYDRPFREAYVRRVQSAAHGLRDDPDRWGVPREGWLPATDAESVAASLATLVLGMVTALERAGPAIELAPPRTGLSG